MKTTTIRPGLLVSLKTRVTGGVEYRREDLDAPQAPDGADAKRWETTRIVEDPSEFEAAQQRRTRCQGLIRQACIRSDFGLLCPSTNEAKLAENVADALRLAREWNETAKRSKVEVYVVTGRIADNDQQAARAIAAEVRGLLEGMQQGIVNGDPEAIRQMATRARQLGGMLDDEGAAKVKAAIADARAAAKAIVTRVQNGGELVAKVVEELKLEDLKKARFAFLDLEQRDETGGEALPAVNQARAAAIDLDGACDSAGGNAAVQQPDLDMEDPIETPVPKPTKAAPRQVEF